MARIYKRTDRIKIKIDDVIVTIAPLSLDQKTHAQEMMAKGRHAKDYKLVTDGIIHLICCAVKEISGLDAADGSPYRLEFDGDMLSKSCVDDIFNIELHKKLVMVCASLIGAFPSTFTDENGNPIEGVEILKSGKKEVEDVNPS